MDGETACEPGERVHSTQVSVVTESVTKRADSVAKVREPTKLVKCICFDLHACRAHRGHAPDVSLNSMQYELVALANVY